MKLTRQNLNAAVFSGLISHDQADQLWAFDNAKNSDTLGFHFTQTLDHHGGMIANALAYDGVGLGIHRLKREADSTRRLRELIETTH